MKLNHKQKVKLAKKMSKTQKERDKHVGIFETEEWDRRKKAKANKQRNQGKKTTI